MNRDAVLFIPMYPTLLEPVEVAQAVDLPLQRNAITSLFFIMRLGRYRLVLVSGDGPDVDDLVKRRLTALLERESIVFDDVAVTDTFDVLVQRYGDGAWDMEHSLVIGSDAFCLRLSSSLGCRRVLFSGVRTESADVQADDWRSVVALIGGEGCPKAPRRAALQRATSETTVSCEVDLDGTGRAAISTLLPFFDHMLQQVYRHAAFDGRLSATGDLEVDEHHTVEDVALTLGSAVRQALGDKRGVNRYGHAVVPMDECAATVALDFSGRPYLVWDVHFSREMVGTFPVELFSHFFKSFSDEAKCTLHMSVGAGNAHHQAEALFKAFGRALRSAVFRHPWDDALPSTKGVL